MTKAPEWPANRDLREIAGEIYRSFSSDLEDGYKLSASGRISAMRALHRLAHVSPEVHDADEQRVFRLAELMGERYKMRFPNHT